MRGEVLAGLIGAAANIVIDTNVPITDAGRLFKSIGWRFYIGPLIKKVNNYIRERLKDMGKGDFVWVDKGVFIEPDILSEIKNAGAFLVHYTPDTAFAHNRSGLFFRGLPYYDACITTKSFELLDYEKAGSQKTIFCTQGYNPNLHQPLHSFAEKKGICFIGLAEPNRLHILSKLIEAGFPVKIGGYGWSKLSKKYSGMENFTFLGERIFGEDYVQAISSSLLALGLLSKRFPELHTTRTFEIPACGTALITEDNKEIRQFYGEDEVLYFHDHDDLVEKIQYYLNNINQLQILTQKGTEKMRTGKYDYPSILKNILVQLDVV
ncbi:CgeB family protein [Flavihumibacter sp.]|uniref:CgeB family protein n=1 Tax=Flavihumibacter sp. TaxID=1913981 RepID=UPI002FC5BF3A